MKTAQESILAHLCKQEIILCSPLPVHLSKDVQAGMIKKCREILPRDTLYEEKHLIQEIGIIHNLSKLIPIEERKSSLVIDVGGGNGDLAFLIYNLLDVQVMVIDKTCPKFKVDILADSRKFSRMVDNFRDVDLKEIKNKTKCNDIYLVCKHLCGTNLDMVLDKIIKSKIINGFVFAPCCYHKGTYGDFIGKDLLSLVDFETTRSVTDWKTIQLVKTSAYNIGCIAENIINSIRLHLLTSNGYKTVAIEHVDMSITPKNVLLIGYQDV